MSTACGGDDDDDGAGDSSDDQGGDGDDGDDGGVGSDMCDADNGSIALPDGFCASIFADDLGPARHLVVSPSGDVFVAVADGEITGAVVALRDTDADGIADERESFGDAGGNGIAWSDGQLFFAQDDRILRYELPDGQLLPDGEPVTVVGGLPADGDHVNKSVVVNASGELLVNIGSASNSCQEQNRVVESLGVNPCPELDVRAGVWSFASDETDQVQEDGIRYGEGLRNMVALAIEPDTGELFGVQNGRDQLFDNFPKLFGEDEEIELPAEELFLIDGGKTPYGWPYCYYDPFQELKVLAPEYGGDGVAVGECADMIAPDFVFPAHWAPLGMTFYTGDMFPEEYQGGAFIAFHGSRFEPEATGDLPGYNVVFLPFDGGLPVQGDFQVFADEFAGAGRPLPDAAEHRPVGVAEGPDGELYISDDYGGRIWRVIYTGE